MPLPSIHETLMRWLHSSLKMFELVATRMGVMRFASRSPSHWGQSAFPCSMSGRTPSLSLTPIMPRDWSTAMGKSKMASAGFISSSSIEIPTNVVIVSGSSFDGFTSFGTARRLHPRRSRFPQRTGRQTTMASAPFRNRGRHGLRFGIPSKSR